MDPLILIICLCCLGACALVGYGLHPSSEATSISQRLQGLKAEQQTRAATSTLRDQDEMNKSIVTRVILPLAEKWSKFFSQLTPVTALNRAKVSIIRAGLQGKINPGQITTLSYILMVVLPMLSLSFAGLPTAFLSKATGDPGHRRAARLPASLRLCRGQGQGAPE